MSQSLALPGPQPSHAIYTRHGQLGKTCWEDSGKTYSSRTRIVSASKVHHCHGVAGIIAARSAVEEAGAFEPVDLLAGPEDLEVGCCEAG
jgi:hypothetical protein